MTHPFFTIGHSARFVTLEEPIRGRRASGAGRSFVREEPTRSTARLRGEWL